MRGRLGWCAFALIGLIPVVVSQAQVVTAATAPSVAAATVHELLTTPVRITSHRDLSCPSASACFLAANPTAKSVDGGATWTPFRLDAFDIGGLTTVDCFTDLVCGGFDGAGEFFRTVDGGAHWTVTRTTGVLSSDQLECPSALHCVAGGQSNSAGALWTTNDGGDTWTRTYLNSHSSLVDHLSCGSVAFCAALDSGTILTTSDGGSSWNVVLPGPASQISCVGAAVCIAVAGPGRLLETTDGGAHWTNIFVTLPFLPSAFRCSSTTQCVGTANVPLSLAAGAFTIDLTTFAVAESTVPNRLTNLDLVDCAGAVCVAVGDPFPYQLGELDSFGAAGVVRSIDGGATWVREPPPPSVERLVDMACIDAAQCVAVGDVDHVEPAAQLGPVVKRSLDGGSSWIPAASVPSLDDLRMVACVPGGACVVAGISSADFMVWGLAFSTDQGQTWSAGSIDVPIANLRGLSCQAGGTCFAVAQQITDPSTINWPAVVLRSTDSGATWHVVDTFAFSNAGEIACQSATTCLLTVFPSSIGMSPAMWATSNGGTDWHPVALPSDAMRGLELTHCSASRCIALLTATNFAPSFWVTADAGLTWAQLSGLQPNGGGVMGCNGSLCVYSVADYQTTLYTSTDGGDSWSFGGPANTRGFASIECQQPTSCLALGPGGSALGSAIVRIDLTVTQAPAPSPVSSIVGVVPARLLETRSGPGMFTVDHFFEGGGLVPAGSVLQLPVTGRGGVAADATSVMLNVTITQPAGSGYVTVFPCGETRPNASSVNYVAGATVANAVITKVGVRGKVCLFTLAATHLVVDVNGYVPASAASLVSVVPARLLETRSGPGMVTVDHLFEGGGVVAAGSVVELPVAGRGGVADAAGAVMLNVTVTEPAESGYVTVFPCGQARPNASTVNYGTGSTVANSAISKVGLGGAVCLFSLGATHLVVDVNGYVPASVSSLASVVPARLLETRSGPGMVTVDHLFEGGGVVTAGSVVELPVAGRGGVPGDAGSAMLNVTATEPAAAGYVTVFPCGASRPLASNINYLAGSTVANSVITKIGAGGKVCLFSLATTHMLVDVDGYAA